MHRPLYSPPPPSCLSRRVRHVFNPLWPFCRVVSTWPCLLTCRSCLDVRGVVGVSVAGRRVVVSLWRVVAVLVMLWMVVVVGDSGGLCCGHVVSHGGHVVMRQGRGGQWTGWW